MSLPKNYSAFQDGRCIAFGSLPAVIAIMRAGGIDPRLAFVFDDHTGDVVQLNTAAAIEGALSAGAVVGVDRVASIALDVRVLPRHKEWLDAQPGGPSVTIRRLIEAARRDPAARVSQAKTAAYRFISMLAGDFEGYEEACRALFAGNAEHFGAATATWPPDISNYGRDLAKPAFNRTNESCEIIPNSDDHHA